MALAMPLEALWNIFTITNKLKYSTYTMLANNILVFLTVVCSMFIVDDSIVKLFVLAGARVFWGILRSLFFLPLYGAYCLGVSKMTFYPPIFKSVLSLSIVLGMGAILISFTRSDTWMFLILNAILICVITVIVNSLVVLQKQDIQFLKSKIFKIRR